MASAGMDSERIGHDFVFSILDASTVMMTNFVHFCR